MKLSLVTSILITISFSSTAQYFTKSNSITVASGIGNYHPQIEITNDGFPAVLWTNIADKNLYFAKFNGTDFNAPIQLNPLGHDVQTYSWSGPDLTIDGDNIYVVYRDEGFQTGHIYLVKSTDNGASWSDTIRVDNLASGFGQFPDIAAYQDTLWVTMMDHDPGATNPQYVVTRSVDGGLNWEPEVIAGELWPGEACDCCPPEISVDADRITLIFRNNNGNVREMKGVISNDRGATFSDMFSIDDHNWIVASCPSTGPDFQFYESDKLMCIYKTEVSNQIVLFVNEYDLQTMTSVDEVEIDADISQGTIKGYPQLDAKNGAVGIVWEGAGDGLDVFFNASYSGAIGLDPANAINVTDTSATQSKPAIVMDDNGKFHIAYADGNGNSVKYLVVTNSALEIEESKRIESNVYPVPAIDKVEIVLSNSPDEKFTFELYSLTGELLISDYGFGSTYSFNKNDLPSGNYIYKIRFLSSAATGTITFN